MKRRTLGRILFLCSAAIGVTDVLSSFWSIQLLDPGNSLTGRDFHLVRLNSGQFTIGWSRPEFLPFYENQAGRQNRGFNWAKSRQDREFWYWNSFETTIGAWISFPIWPFWVPVVGVGVVRW